MKGDKNGPPVWRVRVDGDRPVLELGRTSERRGVLFVTWPDHFGTQRYYVEDLANGTLHRDPVAAIDSFRERIDRQVSATIRELDRVAAIAGLVDELRDQAVDELEKPAPPPPSRDYDPAELAAKIDQAFGRKGKR